jgi:hypothetical protein
MSEIKVFSVEVEGKVFTIKKWKVQDRCGSYFNFSLEYKGNTLIEAGEILYNMKQVRERINQYVSLIRMSTSDYAIKHNIMSATREQLKSKGLIE